VKFVDAMGHAGLLSVAARVAPQPRRVPTAAGAPGERDAAPAADAGLVSRLRRTLGISHKGSA
jgi:hypothetical protein